MALRAREEARQKPRACVLLVALAARTLRVSRTPHRSRTLSASAHRVACRRAWPSAAARGCAWRLVGARAATWGAAAARVRGRMRESGTRGARTTTDGASHRARLRCCRSTAVARAAPTENEPERRNSGAHASAGAPQRGGGPPSTSMARQSAPQAAARRLANCEAGRVLGAAEAPRAQARAKARQRARTGGRRAARRDTAADARRIVWPGCDRQAVRKVPTHLSRKPRLVSACR